MTIDQFSEIDSLLGLREAAVPYRAVNEAWSPVTDKWLRSFSAANQAVWRPDAGKVDRRSASIIALLPDAFSPTRTVRSGANVIRVSLHDLKFLTAKLASCICGNLRYSWDTSPAAAKLMKILKNTDWECTTFVGTRNSYYVPRCEEGF